MTQLEINSLAYDSFLKAIKELPDVAFSRLNRKQLKQYGAKQLRTCNAWVWETPNYYVLQSYETLVAVIEKSSDVCCDVLRTEYGYTSTSAKHISIFRKASCFGGYSRNKWGCDVILTAREIK